VNGGLERRPGSLGLTTQAEGRRARAGLGPTHVPRHSKSKDSRRSARQGPRSQPETLDYGYQKAGRVASKNVKKGGGIGRRGDSKQRSALQMQSSQKRKAPRQEPCSSSTPRRAKQGGPGGWREGPRPARPRAPKDRWRTTGGLQSLDQQGHGSSRRQLGEANLKRRGEDRSRESSPPGRCLIPHQEGASFIKPSTPARAEEPGQDLPRQADQRGLGRADGPICSGLAIPCGGRGQRGTEGERCGAHQAAPGAGKELARQGRGTFEDMDPGSRSRAKDDNPIDRGKAGGAPSHSAPASR